MKEWISSSLFGYGGSLRIEWYISEILPENREQKESWNTASGRVFSQGSRSLRMNWKYCRNQNRIKINTRNKQNQRD